MDTLENNMIKATDPLPRKMHPNT